jgi:predicted Rossmann fold nucleotide-binding protein DprA/Smf involved in DNA uptake
MVDPASRLLVALTSRDLTEDLPPVPARHLWVAIQAAADSAVSPATLFDDPDAWRQLLPAELHATVEERLCLVDAADELLKELREQGVWVTTPCEESWPARLGTRLKQHSPVALYGAGDTSLLGTDGIGIVGSRNLEPSGVEVARSCAAVAVQARVPVISGGARGTDQIAMKAALDAEGSAVGVLTHPLEQTMREPVAAAAIADGKLCLVTPFKPSAGFSVGNAMARNKLIYGLSRVTTIVAADRGKGGTWAGAREALERGFGAVAVWQGVGAGPGNEELASHPNAFGLSDPAQLMEIRARLDPQPSLL